jgi:hypothetical protein
MANAPNGKHLDHRSLQRFDARFGPILGFLTFFLQFRDGVKGMGRKGVATPFGARKDAANQEIADRGNIVESILCTSPTNLPIWMHWSW